MTETAWRDRFMDRVLPEPNSGCWLWDGDLSASGYGRIMINGKRFRAHRVSLSMSGIEVPNDMIVCHSCDVPACVNPSHLFVGTQSDNMKDAYSKGRATPPRLSQESVNIIKSKRLTCKHGHNWIAENIIERKNGKRECRLCAINRERTLYKSTGSRWKERSREWHEKRKEIRRGK